MGVQVKMFDDGDEGLVTSVRVETQGNHEYVTVWTRGAHAGRLTVAKGDGAFVADRLMGEPCTIKMEGGKNDVRVWTMDGVDAE